MAMSEVKISVITVAYNEAATIEATLMSVLEQTYRPIEYIVIDGGSDDGTADIIRKYQDRLAYWVSEPDEGIYDAMNKGIRVAHGDYLNFMNSGDCFYSKKTVEEVVAQIHGEDFVAGIAANMKEEHSKPYSYWMPVRQHFSLGEILCGGLVNHQSSFISRRLFEKNQYDVQCGLIADEAFFVQTVGRDGASYKPLKVVVCKYNAEGRSEDPSEEDRIVQTRMDYLKKIFPRQLADGGTAYKKTLAFLLLRLRYRIRRKWCNIVMTVTKKDKKGRDT
jgi:glycosyltransferase involved in cell wall biosynthesis